jgi:hypothetical protein
MSTEKTKTENVELARAGQDIADTVPDRQLQVLSLEVDDDSGGDPYNRTGQFCIVDLKNKEQ